MIRTQIQLTAAQHRTLKRLAAERGVSMAALLRSLVDRGLETEASDLAARWERASRLVGAFRSKEGDLSTAHDRYLAEDLAK